MRLFLQVLAGLLFVGLAACTAGDAAAEREPGPLRRMLQDRPQAERAPKRGLRTRNVEPPPGLKAGMLKSGGIDRTYYLSIPSSYRGDRALPVVLVFHGGHSNGATIAKTTLMHELGVRQGFFVVYPEAIDKDRVWNDGRHETASPVNDVAYVDDLISYLAAEYRIDRGRIYATGASNGGMFTIRLACDRSTTIKAFAPVVGNLPEDLVSQCKPGRPVPIEFFHGKEDQLMPWNGGKVAGLRVLGRGGGKVISAPDTVAFWARNNGCPTDAETVALLDTDPNDGTRVKMRRYSGCRNDADVVQYIVEGGGHTWPGSTEKPTLSKSGITSQDIRATDIMWGFFQKY
jgi:polyhydroxybutyrate depolymerase